MHKKLNLAVVFLAALMLLTLGAALAQDDALPAFDDLQPGWNQIDTGGDTVCARDTPYNFLVHKTDNTDDLVLFFDGGGACWNQLTCREDGGTFSDAADTLDSIPEGGLPGMFEFDNPLNPVADFNVVFIPYCTADIHVGDAVVAYNDDLSIQHNGATNSQVVLDWVFANYAPEGRVLVTGSSAGAYGAIYHLPAVLDAYNETANVIHFGDAGVGVTPEGWSVLESWGMYENTPFEYDPDSFSVNELYTSVAEAYPGVTLSQYTTAADSVQVLFYGFSQLGGPTWEEGMIANIDALEAEIDTFSSFIAGGDSHTILATPLYYSAAADDVPFLEWFSALLDGEVPDSPRCTDCDEIELNELAEEE